MDITRRYAIISVYYKNVPGFDRLVRALHAAGVIIISTGRTATHIKALGIPVWEVSDLTGFPEMMDGRVKTLHPKVFGGILGRRNVLDDIKKMQEHDIPFIDVVVVNLYPFAEEVAKGDKTTHEKIIENIDVGGPSMIRAGAKNYDRVSVICNPEDYGILADLIERGIEPSFEQREEWFLKTFAMTEKYDGHIRAYAEARKLARQAQCV